MSRCFVYFLLACPSACVFRWWLLSVTFGVGEGWGGWLSIISFNYLKHTKRPKLTSLLWLLKKPCIFHDWETNRMSLSPSPLLWQDKTYHCYLSLLCAPHPPGSMLSECKTKVWIINTSIVCVCLYWSMMPNKKMAILSIPIRSVCMCTHVSCVYPEMH